MPLSPTQQLHCDTQRPIAHVLVITKNTESDAASFVCYHAVTALTERSCQNAMGSARPPPFAHRQLKLGCAAGGSARDALDLPPLCFRATLRFKDRVLPCATNTLLNTCQGRRFAQAAIKSCGSLE